MDELYFQGKQMKEETKMKCPVCNKGNMKKVIDRISKDNIEFETFRCDYCKEELMDGRQLKMLANKYHELRKAKEINFAKWGNSVAIRIPNEFIKDYNIKPGMQALIIKDKHSIKITPSN